MNRPAHFGFLALMVGGLAIGATRGQVPVAPTLPTLFQINASATGPNFGRMLEFVGDLNGDNANELMVGLQPSQTVNGTYTNSSMHIYSSSVPGSVLYTIDGTFSIDGGYIGDVGCGIDDCDGDGVADLAIGRSVSSSPTTVPAVEVYSGATGTLLYTISYPGVYWLSISAIASLGDIDSDAFGDFAIGHGAYNQSATSQLNGLIQVVSGATGTILHQTFGNPGQLLGGSLVAMQDINGDGVRDLAAGGLLPGLPQNSFGVLVYSVTSTQLSLQWTGSGTAFQGNPWYPRSAGDADFDGSGDLMYRVASGVVEIHSGSTGALIRTLPPQGLTPTMAAAGFGAALAMAGDIDGDGIDDHAVVSPLYSLPGMTNPVGSIDFFSGATGSVVFQTLGGVPTAGGFSGTLRLCGGGDMNGDGLSEFAFGAGYNTYYFRVLSGSPAMTPSVADGSVNAFAAGGRVDVLGGAVAGASAPFSVGDGRSIVVPRGVPIDLWMARPPAVTAPTANHLIFGRIAPAASFTVTTLPLGLGDMCIAPSFLAPLDPSLFLLSTTFGGATILPSIPASTGGLGSPCVVIPPIPMSVTFILQGLIEDPSAVGIPLSVTNALRVVVP